MRKLVTIIKDFLNWNIFTLEVSSGIVTIYYRPEGIYRLSLACIGSFFHAGGQKKIPWPGLRRDLERYFNGKGKDIDWNYPIIMQDYTPWTRKVLEMTKKIPFGRTWTYRQLAEKIGSPRAARAVGQALGRNLTPILIPCHRVIGSRGELVGFREGLSWKKELLRIEGNN